MSILSTITNAARAMRGSSILAQSAPAQTPTGPATVSRIPMAPGAGHISGHEEATKITGYEVAVPLFEKKAFEPDEWTAKFTAPPYLPPGCFHNGVFRVPRPRLTLAIFKLIVARAEKDGGPLYSPAIIEAEQADDILYRTVNDTGIQHSVTAAVHLHHSKSTALAERLRQGQDVDAEVQPDQPGVEEHLAQVRGACRTVFSEVTQRHVNRIYSIALRLRDTARSMVTEMAEIEQKAALEMEEQFTPSLKLATLLFFGVSDKHSLGWGAPFSNWFLGATTFSPSNDPWGVGFFFWTPTPNEKLDATAKARAQVAIDFATELKHQRVRDQATSRIDNNSLSPVEREDWNQRRDELDVKVAAWKKETEVALAAKKKFDEENAPIMRVLVVNPNPNNPAPPPT
jgi:hypothetical protein